MGHTYVYVYVYMHMYTLKTLGSRLAIPLLLDTE